MDIPTHEAPERVLWASDEQYIHQDLPNVAFNGDHYHKPMNMSDEFAEYTGALMSIDPSGLTHPTKRLDNHSLLTVL